MQVPIKRFSKDLPLPEYKTAGAAACDLSAREDSVIKPGAIGYVPLNIAVQIPVGHWGLLAARSSLHKRGLMPVNGFGIIDEDYCGDEDEWIGVYYNFTKEPVAIAKGDRVAQMVIIPREKISFVERQHFGDQKNRGGFGSTGAK